MKDSHSVLHDIPILTNIIPLLIAILYLNFFLRECVNNFPFCIFQRAIAPFKHLPAEIESMKAVLEMRNQEIQKLRTENNELIRELEQLPKAKEQITTLERKIENLDAIINIKSDYEK